MVQAARNTGTGGITPVSAPVQESGLAALSRIATPILESITGRMGEKAAAAQEQAQAEKFGSAVSSFLDDDIAAREADLGGQFGPEEIAVFRDIDRIDEGLAIAREQGKSEEFLQLTRTRRLQALVRDNPALAPDIMKFAKSQGFADGGFQGDDSDFDDAKKAREEQLTAIRQSMVDAGFISSTQALELEGEAIAQAANASGFAAYAQEGAQVTADLQRMQQADQTRTLIYKQKKQQAANFAASRMGVELNQLVSTPEFAQGSQEEKRFALGQVLQSVALRAVNEGLAESPAQFLADNPTLQLQVNSLSQVKTGDVAEQEQLKRQNDLFVQHQLANMIESKPADAAVMLLASRLNLTQMPNNTPVLEASLNLLEQIKSGPVARVASVTEVAERGRASPGEALNVMGSVLDQALAMPSDDQMRVDTVISQLAPVVNETDAGIRQEGVDKLAQILAAQGPELGRSLQQADPKSLQVVDQFERQLAARATDMSADLRQFFTRYTGLTLGEVDAGGPENKSGFLKLADNGLLELVEPAPGFRFGTTTVFMNNDAKARFREYRRMQKLESQINNIVKAYAALTGTDSYQDVMADLLEGIL